MLSTPTFISQTMTASKGHFFHGSFNLRTDCIENEAITHVGVCLLWSLEDFSFLIHIGLFVYIGNPEL